MTSRGSSNRSSIVRLLDLLAFFGILGLVLSLALQGVGAASIASIAALVGVCGRIWVSFSNSGGSSPMRRNHAKLSAGPEKWVVNLETETRAEPNVADAASM